MLSLFKDGFVLSYKSSGLYAEEDLVALRSALLNVLQFVPNESLSDDDRCELVGLLRLLTEDVEKKEGDVPSDDKVLV